MKKTICLKLFFVYAFAAISVLFAPSVKGQNCNTLDINVTKVNATCEANGQIYVSVQNNPAVDMTRLEYGISSLDGITVSPTSNGGIFQNVPPGNYTVLVRAFCFSDQTWKTIQAASPVVITTSYVTPNMAIASSGVRNTLSCVNSGMIPLSFNRGLAPYTAKLIARPAAYTGDTVFIKNTPGVLQIEDLPAGTYTFELRDACDKIVTVSINVEMLSSDVPVSWELHSTKNPSPTAPLCKGLRVFFSSLPKTHELYPYLSNVVLANKYFEFVLTETASGKTDVGSISVYTDSIATSGLSLIDYTYGDLYLAADSYPAGIAAAAGAVTVGLRVKDCPTTASATDVTLKRPIAVASTNVTATTAGMEHSVNFTCTGYDLVTQMKTMGKAFCVCYPITVELLLASNDSVIAANVITSGNSTVFPSTPYGTYKIEYTGSDGGQWGVPVFTTQKPEYESYFHLRQPCSADGKNSTISVYANYPYGYFIPGTTIEVISAPSGQAIPPIRTIPAGTNYNVVYLYSNDLQTLTYEKMQEGFYTMRITTPCGDAPVTITKKYEGPSNIYFMYNTGSTSPYSPYYCVENLNKAKCYMYPDNNNYISGNTWIRFSSGPNGKDDPRVIWKDVVIPSGYTKTFNPFHQDYSYTGFMDVATPTHPNGITPGYYTFLIVDGACGNRALITFDVPYPYYVGNPLSYTTEYVSCDSGGNVRVYPSGSVNKGNNDFKFYEIIQATDDAGKAMPWNEYPHNVITEGEYFDLHRNGTYLFQMNPANYPRLCFSDTVSFVYKQPMASIDPRTTSAYVCVGANTGRIRLKGMGGYGNGPYEYEILDSGLPSNDSGVFVYGSAGENIRVRVTDHSPEAQALNCIPSQEQTLTIHNLQTAKIAYKSENGDLCTTDSVELRCVTLGKTSYKWTGPNGYVSTEQYPVLRNTDVSMSGWYVVAVAPEYCGDTIKDSVYVRILSLPNAPVLTNTHIQTCYKSGDRNFAAETGINIPNGLQANWYDPSGSIIPEQTFSTEDYIDTVYAVSLVDTATGCESPLTSFRISTLLPPLPPMMDFPDEICNGDTATIIIPNTLTGYTYSMYTSLSTDTVSDVRAGNGGTLTFKAANVVVENANIYFSITNDTTGCESGRSSVEISFITGSPIEVPETEICGEESAVITVTSSVANPVYRWYNSTEASAALLHTGETYTTPVLSNYSPNSSTIIYYVTVEGTNVCENNPLKKIPVPVTVKPSPLIYLYGNYSEGDPDNEKPYIVGNSSSSTNVVPLYTSANRSYTQQIFTAEEFAGLASGNLITALAWQYIHYEAQTKDNVTIYLGHTTKSAFSNLKDWLPISQMQEVFSGTINFPIANSIASENYWVNIPFDNAFRYDSGNIVVAVLNNHGSAASGSSSTFRNHTADKKVLCYYTQNAIPLNVNPPPAADMLTDKRNNTRFMTLAVSKPGNICIGKSDILAAAMPNGIWSSSDSAIAAIDNEGMLTGISEGKVVITYTLPSEDYCLGVSDTINVIAAPDVSITGNTVICVQDSTQLSPTEGGIWVSNNVTVATVTQKGVVTAVAKGSVTFTFTNEAGCSSTTEMLTVSSPSTAEANISARDTTICVGNSVDLNTLVAAVNVTNPVFHWYETIDGTAEMSSAVVSPSGSVAYYVAVSGDSLCEGRASAVGRQEVKIQLYPYSTASMIHVTGDSVCMNNAATLHATAASEVVNPVFCWYASDTASQPIFTGENFVTPILTDDTLYYATVSGDNYCEGSSSRKAVKVVVHCATMRGTVYPFVYEGKEAFDTLFTVKAALYEIPSIENTSDPLQKIADSSPLYEVNATYYDGSIYIASTPKYPGTLGRINTPGLPIDWAKKGYAEEENIDTSTLKAAGEIPDHPVGMFSFENLPLDKEYLLVVSRAGFLTRFAKIKVTKSAILGHRFLIPGDIDGLHEVNSSGFSDVYDLKSSYGEAIYDARYDLNGDGNIDACDLSLMNFYLNIAIDIYTETEEWLLEY